jgi:hypothetical protein
VSPTGLLLLHPRQVKVCPSCFKVYNLVEKERGKALSKLGPKHHPAPHGGGVTASTMPEDSPEARGIRRAQLAIDALSRNDVTELHNYGNQPPKQVLMLMSMLI